MPDAPLIKPVYSLQQIADFLREGYWYSSFRSPRAFDVEPGDEITVNLTGLTAEGKKLARWALDAWEQSTGIVFVEVLFGGQIIFDDEDPSGAYASTTNLFGVTIGGEINIPVNWIESYGTTIDSYSLQTYIHEIGHVLGLGHGGSYNGSGSFWTDALYQNDSWQMTIMSYFSQSENPFVQADFAWIVTPMIADNLAVFDSYGQPTETHLGDTIYGYGSNLTGYLGDLFGQVFGDDALDSSIYSGDAVAFTVIDSGGIDLIDLSSIAADQLLNLAAGSISNVAGWIGNMVIDLNTVIENGATGSGNDILIGNEVGNELSGGGGFDLLFGQNGDDLLDGQTGVNILFGGDGEDELIGNGIWDLMFGGGDGDSFVFDANKLATYTIVDFEDGIDEIEIDNATFEDLDINDTANGVLIEVGGLDIVVLGVSEAQLSEDDFNFV